MSRSTEYPSATTKQLHLTKISWNVLEGCVQRSKEGEGVLNADLGAAAERCAQQGQVGVALQVALQPRLAAGVAGSRRGGSQGGSGGCPTLGCRCGSLAGPDCRQQGHRGWGWRAQAGPNCGQQGRGGWGWHAQAGSSCKCCQACSWRRGRCGLCRHAAGLCQTLPPACWQAPIQGGGRLVHILQANRQHQMSSQMCGEGDVPCLGPYSTQQEAGCQGPPHALE